MDFSWGWVKRGPAAMTEPLAKARPELARAAMPQATLRLAFLGGWRGLERLEQDLQRQPLLAPPA